ncbi:TPA: hypothetical protein EYO12_01005 [Candidatus Saccharibacteria bacterium]|nr:hypothetical protein [Candidatus Saccharibacteria bacterium]HIO87297.1 hypothetical protein [Candidatus Saccharibacteria bacterium]
MFNSHFTKINHLINQDSSSPKISIIIPTHVEANGQNQEADRIRIKNAFAEVRNSLTLDKELQEAVDVAESKLLSDKVIKELSTSLAVYVSRQTFEMFHLTYETTEVVHCGDSFIVSPIILDKSLGLSMYVFHTSLKNPSLFIYEGGELTELDELDLPSDLQQAMKIDEYLKDKQHHVSGDAIHHGHGASDNKQDDIEVYYKRLANVFDEYLASKELPLLLVGAQERIHQLKANLQYPNVLSQQLQGSYNHLNKTELAEKLQSAVHSLLREDLDQRESTLQSTQKELLADEYADITSAVEIGQVESLYVPVLRTTNDSVRPNNPTKLLFDYSNYNLKKLEQLVRNVISQGGSVLALPSTFKNKAAAKFYAKLRYTLEADNAV